MATNPQSKDLLVWRRSDTTHWSSLPWQMCFLTHYRHCLCTSVGSCHLASQAVSGFRQYSIRSKHLLCLLTGLIPDWFALVYHLFMVMCLYIISRWVKSHGRVLIRSTNYDTQYRLPCQRIRSSPVPFPITRLLNHVHLFAIFHNKHTCSFYTQWLICDTDRFISKCAYKLFVSNKRSWKTCNLKDQMERDPHWF